MIGSLVKHPPEIPSLFLWGAATSSHQVEGNNIHSDWWAWEQAKMVKESSGLACDHYNRFREDIALIDKLGHNAHRFSIEWSRLEPREGEWNDEAFKHYEEVFRELEARGIEPVVTLHHFTNPQWFTFRGGWLSADSTKYFVRYVRKVVQAYGKYVRFWITLNEPLIFLYHSYYAGLWPPGMQSYDDAMTVFRNQLHAHIESYRVIHYEYEVTFKRRTWVSIANHMMYFTPCRPDSFMDRLTIRLRNRFMNYLFFKASISGFLFFPGIFSEFLHHRGSMDFLGVNYYSRDFIRFAGFRNENSLGQICDKAHHQKDVRELNTMGWEVYPDGLYHILMSLKRYKLPIMISENGICAQNDEQRVRFIRDHLGSVERAKKEGVPVFSYFYWSLMDNFEWAHGFGPRFGIVEVDYKTQERKIRESAYVLTEICRKLSHGG